MSGEPVRIELRGLRAFGPHGVSEEERAVGRLIVLDITMTLVDCAAVGDDELAGTIDYGAVARAAVEIVTGTSHRTLEHLCGAIADRLAAEFGPDEIEVRAAKTEPPIPEAIGEVAVIRTGYLGLGSNVGDRVANLRAAIAGLRERGVEVEAVSSGYETEPVGEILDQPDFLNLAIRIATDLEPEQLLDVCKAVEADAGRDFDAPRHSPRPVDVDLLLLGDIELRTERLTLPHREARSRRFVLVPLLELDPDLALPDGTRLDDCLAALGDRERVERFGPIA